MKWLKRLWRNFWGAVIVRKRRGGKRLDVKSYEYNSLRERFNKNRACCGYVTTRSFSDQELIDRIEHPVSASSSLCSCDVSPHEIDAYMEKLISKVKKVPYVEPSGSCDGYNLRFGLANMVEDGDCSDHNYVENVVPNKPNADDIVNIVLSEISRTSKFARDIKISFQMKSGWTGYIEVWLHPKIYYGKPGGKTDFSEIYLVEKDPSFLNWESVCYRDEENDGYQPSYNIYLNTVDKWDRYPNHYSGIWSVSWVDFIKPKTKESL